MFLATRGADFFVPRAVRKNVAQNANLWDRGVPAICAVGRVTPYMTGLRVPLAALLVADRVHALYDRATGAVGSVTGSGSIDRRFGPTLFRTTRGTKYRRTTRCQRHTICLL